jgi:carbohydrate kinase (thermoresistant glucokinase family)
MAAVSGRAETLHVVVMGVSGVGKSTIAKRLADVLSLTFAEGDDFHPAANVRKMSEGVPLTDDDRLPWLEALAAWTVEQEQSGRSTVVTCSALRRAYRDVLRGQLPETFFVHLTGVEDDISDRMTAREHFMPASLLRSQLDTLEPLGEGEHGAAFDVRRSIDELVTDIVSVLSQG